MALVRTAVLLAALLLAAGALADIASFTISAHGLGFARFENTQQRVMTVVAAALAAILLYGVQTRKIFAWWMGAGLMAWGLFDIARAMTHILFRSEEVESWFGGVLANLALAGVLVLAWIWWARKRETYFR